MGGKRNKACIINHSTISILIFKARSKMQIHENSCKFMQIQANLNKFKQIQANSSRSCSVVTSSNFRSSAPNSEQTLKMHLFSSDFINKKIKLRVLPLNKIARRTTGAIGCYFLAIFLLVFNKSLKVKSISLKSILKYLKSFSKSMSKVSQMYVKSL